MGILKKYGYLWVTLTLFLGSLAGHWTCSWFDYVNQQRDVSRPPVVSDYIIKAATETLENWQSEFMQLIWQVAGLSLLLHVGSPQSKEGDDRKEEKLDALIKLFDPEGGGEIIRTLDRKYPRK
jgi:hypothetical protein